MTTTGHSCINKRSKTKHGCPAAAEYYCNATGKIIDPMTCNKDCKSFETICKAYRRQIKDDEVIL
jgi:hypothetical protein